MANPRYMKAGIDIVRYASATLQIFFRDIDNFGRYWSWRTSLAGLIRHVTVTDVTLQAVYLNRSSIVPVNEGNELTPALVQNPPSLLWNVSHGVLYTVVMTGKTTQNHRHSVATFTHFRIRVQIDIWRLFTFVDDNVYSQSLFRQMMFFFFTF